MLKDKEKAVAFQLKGGLYPLTALQLLHGELDLFEEQLLSKIRQAPKFFKMRLWFSTCKHCDKAKIYYPLKVC